MLRICLSEPTPPVVVFAARADSVCRRRGPPRRSERRSEPRPTTLNEKGLRPHVETYHTYSQFGRWLLFRDRLAERLSKTAEANPDFNPVHFIKHKLVRGRKSLNGLPIEEWLSIVTPGGRHYLKDNSVQLRARVEEDDILIGGDFDSIDEK